MATGLSLQHDAAMSRYARGYLIIAGCRNLLLAATAAAGPVMFQAVLFEPLERIPLWLWSASLGSSGLFCLVAAVERWADAGRTALIVSTILASVLFVLITLGAVIAWSGAVELALADGQPWWGYLYGDVPPGTQPAPSAVLPVCLAALLAKDVLRCFERMRYPWQKVADQTREG